MGRPRRTGSFALPVAVLALVTVTTLAACGGGGTDNRDLSGSTAGTGGEKATQVQFLGADKVKLSGTLTIPLDKPKGSIPGVLFVPGTGRTDRDGVTDLRQPDTLYRDLSQALTKAGIATFRYDRRGVGLSKLDISQQRIAYGDLVDDAAAALTFLAQRQETDGAPIAVVGYDTGSLVATSLAATNNKVKGVVLISPPGRPVADVYADSFAKVNGQASADAFRAEVAALMSTGVLPGADQIRPEHQPVLPPNQDDLLKTLFSLDPLADAARVTVPALIMTGNRSTLANAGDAAKLAQVLKAPQLAAFDTQASLEVKGPDIPPPVFDPNDMNTHTFGASPYSTLDREPTAVSRVVSFVTGSLGGKK